MFAVKVGFLLAIALVAQTQEVDWLKCLQKALITGVPEIDVPGHDPLHIPRDFFYKQPYSLFWIFFSLKNLVLANIPWFEVREFIEVYNDDDFLVYDFSLYWDNLTLSTDYKLDIADILMHTVYFGEATIEFVGVTWTGSFNISKARGDSLEYVNELIIKWTNEDISINVTNLAEQEEQVDVSLEGALQSFLEQANVNNIVGETFQVLSNGKWLNNATRMADFAKWCLNNP